MAEIDYHAAPTHPISVRTNGSSAKHHTPHANTEEYQRMYKESIENPAKFWDEVSRALASLGALWVGEGGVVSPGAPLSLGFLEFRSGSIWAAVHSD